MECFYNVNVLDLWSSGYFFCLYLKKGSDNAKK